MPRPPRLQSPGYYHVTTRGNDGMPIYVDADDKRLFLALLDRIAGRSDWTLQAWCLMTNHFHVIAEIRRPNLSSGMHRLNGRYAHLFNERHARTGHLFERRYDAKPIESDDQMRNTVEYVFDNPVKAGLCRDASEWPWLGGELKVLALSAHLLDRK